MCAAVRKATKMMYQASLTVYLKHSESIKQYWWRSTDPYPMFFMLLSTVDWPTLKRGEVISSKKSPAKGCCFGLSRGLQPFAFCHTPHKFLPLIQQVIKSAALAHPNFRYTSMQVNVDLSAALHADSSNLGPSLTLAIGPHVGGNLWVFRSEEGSVLDIGKWSLTNGRIPHKSLPHAGHRISIVLFTHSAAASRNSSTVIAAASEAGFPVPACPATGSPSIEDLRFINKGMQAAVTAFRLMCESTITVATDTMLPSHVPPEDATWNGAQRFMT